LRFVEPLDRFRSVRAGLRRDGQELRYRCASA
jgi:hypothetical protein